MMGVTTPMATDMRSPRGGMTGGLNTPLRGGMGGSAFGGGHDSGLSVPQQQVLDTITACTSEQGIGLGDLRQRLRGLSDNLLRLVSIDDSTQGGLTYFRELFTVIPWPPKDFKRK